MPKAVRPALAPMAAGGEVVAGQQALVSPSLPGAGLEAPKGIRRQIMTALAKTSQKSKQYRLHQYMGVQVASGKSSTIAATQRCYSPVPRVMNMAAMVCSTIIQFTPLQPSKQPTETAANTQMCEVDTGIPGIGEAREDRGNVRVS